MAISFTELAGSPDESYSPQGFSATREILVPWATRDEMIRALLGNNESFGGSVWANYPNRSDVKVSAIQVVPWDTKVPDAATFDEITEDLNGYTGQLAHMTIKYAWLPPASWPDPKNLDLNIEPGTQLTYRSKLGGEYRSLPGLHVRWARNENLPVPKDAADTIRVPIVEHHLTWHRVTAPPIEAMRERVGKVNDALWNGYKKETLLYEGSTLDRQFIGFPPVDPLGNPPGGWNPWKVTHVFREKILEDVNVATTSAGGNVFQTHIGWNHTWSNVSPDVEPIWDRLIPTANPLDPGPYEVANFDALFQNA